MHCRCNMCRYSHKVGTMNQYLSVFFNRFLFSRTVRIHNVQITQSKLYIECFAWCLCVHVNVYDIIVIIFVVAVVVGMFGVFLFLLFLFFRCACSILLHRVVVPLLLFHFVLLTFFSSSHSPKLYAISQSIQFDVKR